MMRSRRSLRSRIFSERQRIAMISEATVMSKPSSRGTPFVFPWRPSTIWRSWRSFMSTTRFQVIRRESMPNSFPWWMWLSIKAASRLLAIPMAWKSPVKWRLISSIGTTWAYPPPAAPPLIPKTGPREGSRRAMTAFSPIAERASTNPTEVVVFPSPAGVGEMAVTRISFPSSLSLSCSSWLLSILALYFP